MRWEGAPADGFRDWHDRDKSFAADAVHPELRPEIISFQTGIRVSVQFIRDDIGSVIIQRIEKRTITVIPLLGVSIVERVCQNYNAQLIIFGNR